MTPECPRISDQLRRALSGDAWHGPPLSELLREITPEQARQYPVASAHSVWELVLHIEIYLRVSIEAIEGVPMPQLFTTGADWPEPTGEWTATTEQLWSTGEQLARAIEQFNEARLSDTVPGRDYDFYYLFHGLVQHSLYHGGQIALLKRALTSV